MKKSLTLILVLLMLLGLCACGDNGSGFMSTDRTVSGGVAQNDVNLKEISAEKADDGTVAVRFSFVNGSITATGNESSMSGVPEYSISFCENPTRLVLSLKNLSYWDFQQNGSIKDESGLVLGCFKVLPAGGRTHAQIYLNLSSAAEFKVEEADGAIIVYLHKKDSPAAESYHVVGNLFYEYQEGSLDDEAELTPTVTSDGSAVVMISRAFSDIAEAEAMKAELEQKYSILLENKQLRIVRSEGGSLPAYSDSGVINELNDKILINRGGVGESANVFFVDGRMLCVSNDGKKAVFSRKEYSDIYESEKLFIVDNNGNAEKLTEYEITSVAFAMFSPDDKYLFYVEQIEGTMLGSIYRFSDKKLISIDEEVLGTFITGASWSDDSEYIYLMAGNDIPYLKKYSVSDGQISYVIEQECIETEIFCSGSNLYFNTVIDEKEALIKLDLKSLESEQLASCDYFTVDSTGDYILYVKPYNEQEGRSVLSLYDIGKRKSTTVIENVMLGEYFFSKDSRKVYFAVDADSDAAGDFVQKICEYDIKSGILTELFMSIDADFAPSWDSDELIMKISYEKNGDMYPATYRIKIK